MANLMGFPMAVGVVHVQKFADIMEAETELRCPTCSALPSYKGEYTCTCGSRYNHWSRLKRVLKTTGEAILKPKLTDGETVNASAYIMDGVDFAKYADATLTETIKKVWRYYGIVTKDEKSASNLKKLLIATKVLDKVILITFKDTYEERVAILTVSSSGRILLKEIIPLNLAEIRETMRVSLSNITPKELEEAKAFVKDYIFERICLKLCYRQALKHIIHDYVAEGN